MKRLSNGLANGLKANGIEIGDRVGILLPQPPKAGIAHIAVYKMGAVVMPLFTLFGTEALEYRLNNSQAVAVIADEANLPKILETRDDPPHLKAIILTRGKPPDGVLAFEALVEKGSPYFQPLNTRADDPAFSLLAVFKSVCLYYG